MEKKLPNWQDYAFWKSIIIGVWDMKDNFENNDYISNRTVDIDEQ